VDDRDEEMLREIELLGGRRVPPGRLRRALGWNNKTLYVHLKFLVHLGKLSRQGTDIDLIVDGESSEALARMLAVSHMREIERRAKSGGRWLAKDLGEWFTWLAYASGPLRAGRRGRPRKIIIARGEEAIRLLESVDAEAGRRARADRRLHAAQSPF